MTMTPGFTHTGTWYDLLLRGAVEVTDLMLHLDLRQESTTCGPMCALERRTTFGHHEAQRPASFSGSQPGPCRTGSP